MVSYVPSHFYCLLSLSLSLSLVIIYYVYQSFAMWWFGFALYLSSFLFNQIRSLVFHRNVCWSFAFSVRFFMSLTADAIASIAFISTQ